MLFEVPYTVGCLLEKKGCGRGEGGGWLLLDVCKHWITECRISSSLNKENSPVLTAGSQSKTYIYF